MNKPKKGVKKVFYLFKETFFAVIDDNVIKLSAALSYYTIFSLAPLLIIITSICSLYFKTAAIEGVLYEQIKDLVGSDAALQIQEMLQNAGLASHSTFATIISIIILVIGASGIFVEIQDSINYIWGIKAKPKRGLMKFVVNRLTSFSMIVSMGFLLLVGLIFSALMEILNKKLLAYFPHEEVYLYYLINIVLLFVLIVALFITIFKILPDGKISFADCFLGAFFTAIFFMIGKFAIGAYMGSTNIASIYGSAGSVIIILVWVYYSAIILYFGAEFTKVYSKSYGNNIVPNDYTVVLPKSQNFIK